MSIGTAVRINSGSTVNANRLFIQLKNKNVYVFPQTLSEVAQAALTAKIRAGNGRVHLKHWKRVR